MTTNANPAQVHPTTTEIAVAGANCPWCFNDTLDVLRRTPGVRAVDGSITGQCVRVVHDGLATDELVELVRRHLHADGTYAAEHVMVAVDPRVADLHCTHHPGTEHQEAAGPDV
jgi:hypothetical protein